MIKTCLLGLGRTGIVVAEQLLCSTEFELASIIVKPHSKKVNHKLAEFIQTESDLTIKDSNSLIEEFYNKQFKVAIDFTTPEGSLRNTHILAEKGVHLVIGTTGFSKMQLFELKKLVQQNNIGLVYAPNISEGINILLTLVKTLAKLIPNHDVEIVEYHHRNKIDAPSGTAMKIANEINAAKGKDNQNFNYGRKGSDPRETSEIGIHAVRAGGIVGVHRVLFAGSSDEIEITHRSYSRTVFAEGALKAVKFVCNRKGFYNMEDVLSLKDNFEQDENLEITPENLKFNYN